jgi:hypothetical protein
VPVVSPRWIKVKNRRPIRTRHGLGPAVGKRQIGRIDRSAEVLVIEPDEHAVSVYRRDDAVPVASLRWPVDHAAIDVVLFGSDHSSAHSFELVSIEAHGNTTQVKLLDSDQSRRGERDKGTSGPCFALSARHAGLKCCLASSEAGGASKRSRSRCLACVGGGTRTLDPMNKKSGSAFGTGLFL